MPEPHWIGTRPIAGQLRVLEGIRPGVVAFSLGHGHWANGRFYDCGEKEIKTQIERGAERRRIRDRRGLRAGQADHDGQGVRCADQSERRRRLRVHAFALR